MVQKAKLTTKGQLTIPKSVREEIELSSGDEVLFVESGGAVKIYRLPAEVSPEGLFGSFELSAEEPVNLEETRRSYREKLVNKHSPPEQT